ncbi:tRNA uridine-5-carboxymethylaminomethyl(34) synthesis enzyme MnmG [bacterium]
MNKQNYNIIVIGGGHAGCEAALASVRMGMSTLLVTMNLDTIAQLSCNPAIGGIAKGQIVREVDALGGEIGRVTDKSMIQFRMLNMSKGPAVQSPRAQCDRELYHTHMKQVLEETQNLAIKQAEVSKILTKNSKAIGILTSTHEKYLADAVIITAGTFLKGIIHIGLKSFPAGRAWEFASNDLSENLLELGFKIKRLKTGTPVRIHKNSIDFSKVETQYGDNAIYPFSYRTESITNQQLPCWITYTTKETSEIIQNNLDKSPLYSGKITGIGPRYCPSIEDKIVKFPHMKRHHVFLEPEGLTTNEIYCNGISSSLPSNVQENIVHSIIGLENAQIVRTGYGIEYDYMPPTQLKATLESKNIKDLYFAGQVNGTTGYEEAAGQGIMAGINAALHIQKKEPFILTRSESYIGVLIDDLVTKGVLDPYRMFTSRAEYRLLIRNDNADQRLLHYGHAFGLINDSTFTKFKKYKLTLHKIKQLLKKKYVKEKETTHANLIKQDINHSAWAADFTEILNAYSDENYPWNKDILIKNVNIEIKYEGYIKRQIDEVKSFQKLEKRKLPEDIDYDNIVGLSNETKQKLKEIKALTIGQASRISGVCPSDISLLTIHLEKILKNKPKK